jgi:hypothetical protein
MDQRDAIASWFTSVLHRWADQIQTNQRPTKSEIGNVSNINNQSDQTSMDSLDDETTVVGGSLIVSLWQAFTHRVHQWVGNVLLRDRLCRAQRHSLADISNSNGTRGIPEEKYDDMTRHAARYCMPIFLLIDSLGLDEASLTKEYLDGVTLYGQYLNMELLAAHDLSRRSSSSEPVEVYLQKTIWHPHHQRLHQQVLKRIGHEQLESAVARLRSWYQAQSVIASRPPPITTMQNT